MTDDELTAWLRLTTTAGLGPVLGRRLLAAFGPPERLADAPAAAVAAIVGPALAAMLRTPDPALASRVDATRGWLAAAPPGAPRALVPIGDPRYPAPLLQTADPPLLLWTSGRVELLQAPGLAIVGSRRASPQGLENAREFARALSEAGLTIVSGLAMGVDAAAHEGGLAGAGRTIAFVGTGLDIQYPSGHAALARRIAAEGLLVSDYPLGTPPLAANFPRRNRLIAGLSRGTLVVEAALKSGSLITARLAAEAGREVFAIPGSIHSPQSTGCHRLIRDGATLVESAADILAELGPAGPTPSVRMAPRQPSLFMGADAARPDTATGGRRTVTRDDPDAALLDALGHDPVTFDALAERTGEPAERLAARLLGLELDGRVHRLPGGLLQRRGLA